MTQVSVLRAILVLMLVGGLARLAALGSPAAVVFDEVHWGKAVNAYCCTGARHFDVHPPHGKLLLTLGAAVGGYRGGMSFDAIGLPYGPGQAFAMRWLPAAIGTAIPLLFFVFVRRLGGSVPVAFLGGLVLALDNALVLESRVMLLDGLLVASILAALVCLLQAEAASSAARARLWRLGCGAVAGLAVGVKFTGLVAPVLVALWWASRLRDPGRRRGLWRDAAETSAAGVATYLGGWAAHFGLLTNPGPADAFHATTGRFFTDLTVVHRTMLAVNYDMRTPHPDASVPLSWPWMKVAPFFWTGSDASIYLVGNPLVWWGSSVLLIGVCVAVALMRVTTLRLQPAGDAKVRLWLPAAGFAIAYLPYFGIERVLFLYHYLTPLCFAVATVLLWLQHAGWTRGDGLSGQRASYYAVVGLLVLGFVVMSPLTYGFSAGGYDEWLAATLRDWR